MHNEKCTKLIATTVKPDPQGKYRSIHLAIARQLRAYMKQERFLRERKVSSNGTVYIKRAKRPINLINPANLATIGMEV